MARIWDAGNGSDTKMAGGPPQPMHPDNFPVRPGGIGAMLVSSRSLAEYRAMFALTDGDLAKRILDCPAGAASFTAEVNAGGGDIRACDLVYAEQGVDELAARSLAETDRGNRYVRAHPEQYRWTFFADPDEHQRSRRASGVRFATDLRAHPERYVPGRLPHLPFADASFDLVLSSHLLFSYADRLDLPAHRDMICELIRVTRSELRIFPLAEMGHTEAYPMLDALRAQLAELRVSSRFVDVDYEFQAGCKQMLLCRHCQSGNAAVRSTSMS
ncbi:MAG: methyltransferase domain-containing protein [Pseudonocardiaceae bacterium]